MTPTQIADLLAGNYYVEAVAGGTRIRGQVLPRTVDLVSLAMAGTQVTPPTGSGATGSCSADLDSYPVSLAVNCTHDVASSASAHVHAAPFGDDGSVVYTFASPASPFAAGVPLGMVDIASFAAGFLYVDVHSALFPDGEIRGQIDDDVPEPPAPQTTFSVASATSTGTISGSISGGGATCSIDTVSATTASAVAGGGPDGVTFEHGLVDIRLTGCLAGDEVTFTIVYPDALPAGASFWKWGPTPGDATPHWYTIPTTIVGDTVEYTITDGDLGDDDLLENGVIEDPGGPGVATAVPAMPRVLLVISALALFLLAGRRAAIRTAR
jgi:hypothetical protein